MFVWICEGVVIGDSMYKKIEQLALNLLPQKTISQSSQKKTIPTFLTVHINNPPIRRVRKKQRQKGEKLTQQLLKRHTENIDTKDRLALCDSSQSCIFIIVFFKK